MHTSKTRSNPDGRAKKPNSDDNCRDHPVAWITVRSYQILHQSHRFLGGVVPFSVARNVQHTHWKSIVSSWTEDGCFSRGRICPLVESGAIGVKSREWVRVQCLTHLWNETGPGSTHLRVICTKFLIEHQYVFVILQREWRCSPLFHIERQSSLACLT